MQTLMLIFLAKVTMVFAVCDANEIASENPKADSAASFKDPVIARADIVYDQGPATCPHITTAANGDLIVGWNTQGDGMPGQESMFSRSNDRGRTWAAPYLAFKPERPHCGLSVTFYRLPDRMTPKGTMLVGEFELEWPATDKPDPAKSEQYLKLAAGRKFDYFYRLTHDNGHTLSERQRLNDSVKRNDFPQGNIIELLNGDLLWPWGYWGADPLNGFRRSIDGGLTWQLVERAWQDPPPGETNALAFNETAVTVCKDGSIIAIARVDALVAKHFWQIKSSDNGHTWSTPRKIEMAGGSPALYCTDQGQLWLAYRDGGIGPGLGFAVSDDNGKSWRFLYHLKESKGEHEKLYGHVRYTDGDRHKAWRPAEGVVGYPCFQRLSPHEVYVVFHAHNRAELPQRYPVGSDPFYIVGNLLTIPE